MKRQKLMLDSAMGGLVESIARLAEKGELRPTAIPELSLFRRTEPSEPITGMYEPSVCLIAQGAKRVQLGNDTYIYDASHYLFAGLHLPVVAQVIEASHEKPYLGLKLTFDYRDISQLMADSLLPPPRTQKTDRGMATGELTVTLVNAFQRLVDLLDDEQDIPILAPVIQREIYYRLLVGDQGARLRQLAAMGTQSQQVARVITWLKANFSKPLRVDELAEMANMGTSTFHHHFRSMTALSPLQYQKHLRLQEARRLMLSESIDAASAAFQVGYESPTQFSREYSRLFGAPPMRDITNLRQMVTLENE
ncbi:AraC family transcriptional regulator [Syntrophotalea acetylenica]|uniref:AraC family transcriptional regulator n=1 Tax=Syntrophotalea acetylenica TaxID=29542 RepID=A0A1L3GDR8_SYNAC|nr:AraC family transcriptional regulator [Syntrophotalea acetylenica]APG23965.1 AraC family transcriptional regulator [Syntrophotalea acetylenica]APG44547.1 AraC family transcriptional regulator [Syntrophotalea acetylenica]